MVDSPKEKKKRGRKPKPKPDIPEVKIPKKRGRKPKIKLISEEEKNKFILPSKRGRKPKDKNNIFNKNLNLDNISNLILHLPLSLEIIEEIDKNTCNSDNFNYNPNIYSPYPYDPSIINNETKLNANNVDINITNNCIYTILNEENKEQNVESENMNSENMNSEDIETEDIENEAIEKECLYNYNNYIKTYSKIQKNNIKCNWCLHNCSDNDIYKLPYNIINNNFNLYGNFCCPECAVAFNFNELNDEYLWERYALLNYLYNKTDSKLNMSPSRLVLDIFGGPLNINEYRNIIKTKKNINIIMPPHYIICPQVEVTQNKDIFIPLNINRINKYSTDLKLKRNKPVSNNNTLESCMNLKCI